MNSIEGKTVLVVGGSSGIGLGIAKVAAEAGGRVTVASRSAERVAAAAAEIGHGAVGRTLDATDDGAIADFFGDGTVWDHVVASAGKGGRGRLPDQTMEVALAAMDAKFWAYFRVARAAKIADSGTLTFISGALSRKPMPGASLVSAVNAAVEAMARGLALDLVPTRVNVVCPGIIDTPLWDQLSDADRKALYERSATNLPVRRIGYPEDVGHAVNFLMTNPFATGEVLMLEGGGTLL